MEAQQKSPLTNGDQAKTEKCVYLKSRVQHHTWGVILYHFPPKTVPITELSCPGWLSLFCKVSHGANLLPTPSISPSPSSILCPAAIQSVCYPVEVHYGLAFGGLLGAKCCTFPHPLSFPQKCNTALPENGQQQEEQHRLQQLRGSEKQPGQSLHPPPPTPSGVIMA